MQSRAKGKTPVSLLGRAHEGVSWALMIWPHLIGVVRPTLRECCTEGEGTGFAARTLEFRDLCAPAMQMGLRFATNFSVDGHITTQTGRIVKHFQEIRCSWKSLSGNGLRDILHVVSRKIAEINPVNRGAWPFRILRAKGGVNTAQYVTYDTLFVVFKMQSVDLMPR